MKLPSFDPIPGQTRNRPVRWGAIALGITVLVIVVGIMHPNPFAHSTKVRAHFAVGSGLHIYPNTVVRIHGIDVGKVTGSKLDPAGGQDLDMSITDKDVKVRDDASVYMNYRTLLGRNVFIDLNPGTKGRPELGDATIPTSRTRSQVEVDQVLRTFNIDARHGLQTFFGELSAGLKGDGARTTIAKAGPALQHTGAALDALRGQRPAYDLPQLVQNGKRATAALDKDEDALAGLIDNGSMALGVTAARHADVGSIVQQGPSTLAETRQTMARLRTTLDTLDPVVERLRPGVRALKPAAERLTPTMGRITRLVPTAVPTLRDLRPALVNLASLGRTGIPLIDGLDPTLKRTADSIDPFLDARSPVSGLRNGEAIGPVFATVSDSASQFDDGGFMQRFQPGNVGSGKALAALGSSECTKLQPNPDSAGSAAACKSVQQAISLLLSGGTPTPSGDEVGGKP